MSYRVEKDGEIYGIIIKSKYDADAVEFLSPESFPQQLGIKSADKGENVDSHRHKERERSIRKTQETIFVRSGSIQVTFFDDRKEEIEKVELKEKDVALFASGGHSLDFEEDSDIVIVKQGPYEESEDKTKLE